MDIRQLRYFLTIADEGHITSAARKLRISQPPLSHQLKLLEEELGITLFVRGKESMQLTPEGKVLYRRAQVILENFDSTIDTLDNIRNGVTGLLSIGAIGSASLDYLPQSIKQLLQGSPGAQFHIYEGSSHAILTMLNKGTIELGMIREPFNHDLFHHRHLQPVPPNPPQFYHDYYVAAGLAPWFEGSNADLALLELKEKPLIVHRIDRQKLIAACAKLGFTPHIICTNENFTTSISWAIQGLGIAVLPHSSENLIGKFKLGETLVTNPILDLSAPSAPVLIWKKGHCLSTIARRYIELFPPAANDDD